jgi:hypothetical protein
MALRDQEARGGAEADRQQVEEEGAVVGRLERHHFALHLGRQQVVQAQQVGRLAGQGRAVIDQLEGQAGAGVVEFGHGAGRVPGLARSR